LVVTAIAVGLLAAGSPPSSSHALGVAEANWFKQGWGSTLRAIGELRRRLVELATAISQCGEYLRKAHQQANRLLNVCDPWWIRNRGDSKTQAERIKMELEGKSDVLPRWKLLPL